MLRTIKRLLGQHAQLMILPLVLLSLNVILAVFLHILLYFTVIRLLSENFSEEILMKYSLLAIIILVVRLILGRYGNDLSFSRGAHLCGDLRLTLANHYKNLSLGYFDSKESGYLLDTLTSDISTFELLLTHSLPSLVTLAVGMSSVFLALFAINWQLALVQTLILAIAVPILLFANKRVVYYGKKKRRTNATMISTVLEYLRGIKTFKSANMTGQEFTRLSNQLEDSRRLNLEAEKNLSLASAAFAILISLLLPMILIVGTYLYVSGRLSAEVFLAYLFLDLALVTMLSSFQQASAMLKDLQLAALNLEKTLNSKVQGYSLEPFVPSKFEVEFKDVSFSYVKDAPVLHALSFKAAPGTRTAIVGASGSGKSTIANLITRFWDCDSGTISIDGRDIKTINPEEMWRYMAMVFQESRLLSDSIYENIRCGRPSATKEEVIAAAKAAHAAEFIEALPDQYDTVLSEGGVNLSGGERQRIAIARAILKDAPILLLDESTSALDADNEEKINRGLDQLMRNKTVFVIAHRLHTIRKADQILFIDQGGIVESGTHDELMALNGRYTQLIRARERAQSWIVSASGNSDQ
ncbi:MAG: ABC transporter ATP-binding protein [Eubacteriales bacterium]|nr:ABC transporter ATP-binding protein [Eubacteriales bacterium]